MATLLLDCIPADLEVDRDGDGFIVTVAACESSEGFYLTLDCRLGPMPDHEIGTYEFSFGFTVSDLDGGMVPFLTQDRYEVARYFGDLSREYVIPTVCAAVCTLVEDVQPTYIFRVTKGKNLPKQALFKHFAISDVLHGYGFRDVDTGTDAYGRTFWLLGR